MSTTPTAKVDPKQKATYDVNYNYLNQITSISNPPPNPPTQQAGPTTIAQTYDDNETAYVTALGGYRTALFGYDLSKVADQRAPVVRPQNLALRKIAETVAASWVVAAAAITKSFPLAWKVQDVNKAVNTVSFDPGSKVNSARVNYLMAASTDLGWI